MRTLRLSYNEDQKEKQANESKNLCPYSVRHNGVALLIDQDKQPDKTDMSPASDGMSRTMNKRGDIMSGFDTQQAHSRLFAAGGTTNTPNPEDCGKSRIRCGRNCQSRRVADGDFNAPSYPEQIPSFPVMQAQAKMIRFEQPRGSAQSTSSTLIESLSASPRSLGFKSRSTKQEIREVGRSGSELTTGRCVLFSV